MTLLISLTEAAMAQSNAPTVPGTRAVPYKIRMYGKGAPFRIEDLPAQSRLRDALEKIPEAAKLRAKNWLHEFSFPEADTDSLQVDQDGGVFYSDTETPEAATNEFTAESTVLAALPSIDVFKLHSHPGASRTVFLDFDGHVLTGTAWNTTYSSLNAMPFDIDGNSSTFSSDERSRIHEIWHRVAEDYAPFGIDVTTEEPASFGPAVGRILITKSTDFSGLAMPSKSAGGVAYVNVFGKSNYGYYSPALVYYNNLGSGHAPYVAESASHEFGHNLGLSHDGTSSSSYYSGMGSGYSSWAPIMGVGYYTNVTEWSKGEYAGANNTQDDISIIAGKLTFRNDDHGNAIGAATLLAVENDGSLFATNPQNDPGNTDPVNKGIIERQGDIDVFVFDAGAGTVNLSVTPAWTAFTRSGTGNGQGRGANLDIKATLYNQAGSEISNSNPLDNTSALINASVSGGRYYLAITGVGNASIPYSSYGSEGEFFITGSVPPSATAVSDTTPPSPNPTWQSNPSAQGATSIAMTSTLATDASGVVQYRFLCVAGGSGCVHSDWQASPNYVIGGLAAGTSYTFQIVARDAFGNQTPASAMASATTLAATNQNPLAKNDSASVRRGRTVSIDVLANDSDPDGDSLVIVSTAKGQIANGKTISYTAGTATGTDTFTYTVSDGKGGVASATVTVTVRRW